MVKHLGRFFKKELGWEAYIYERYPLKEHISGFIVETDVTKKT